MPALRVLYEGTVAGVFEWDEGSVLIGRDPSADVDLTALDDLSVSRSHARIERIGDGHELRDVGAKNPIKINGRVATRHVLTEGDEIQLGSTTLVFDPVPNRNSTAQASVGPCRLPASSSNAGGSERETTVLEDDTSPIDVASLKLSRRRLLLLYDLSRQFYASQTPHELLTMVCASVCRVTGAERAFGALFGSDFGEVLFAVGHNMVVGQTPERWPISWTIIKRVLDSGTPLITDNATADPSFREAGSVSRLKIRSVLCCPIVRADRSAGLIYTDRLEQDRAFSPEDLDLLEALSFHVETALVTAESREEIFASNARLQREHQLLQQGGVPGRPMIGESSAIRKVIERIGDIARIPDSARVSVLVTGETGTGKELVARTLHALSPRRGKPLVTVNCAAIPESLVDSELFGVERGVATGVSARTGYFEAAEGGIIFLDEIGDMNPPTQAKVLRVIQDRCFTRVGARNESHADVWVVAATNKDLQHEVEQKRFRADLYYRLKVCEVALPPLRERDDDIERLAHFIVDKYCREFGKQAVKILPDALTAIRAYAWPGNVRELENTLAGCVAFCRSESLRLTDLPAQVRTARPPKVGPIASLAEVEKEHLLRVLERTEWNISRAAELLGLGRQAVYHKIEKHGLNAMRAIG